MKLTDILDGAGLALLTFGAFLLATPVGCVVAGGALLVASRGITKARGGR